MKILITSEPPLPPIRIDGRRYHYKGKVLDAEEYKIGKRVYGFWIKTPKGRGLVMNAECKVLPT